MRKGILLIIFSLPLLFFSCKENQQNLDEFQVPKFNDSQLVNWLTMNERGWKNLSFPVWFSTSIIEKQEIKSIQMEFVSYAQTDTTFNSSDTIANRIFDFYFKKNGQLENFVIQEYTKGIKIAENSIRYSSLPDSNGYTLPTMTNTFRFDKKNVFPFISTLQEMQQFQRLEYSYKTDEVLVYNNQFIEERQNHFFILDSVNRNVVFIDRLSNSKVADIFYYGFPNTFTASFKLKNLVEKSLVEEREYYENKVIKSQFFYTQDFITKRYFNYDSNGFCTGFIDSLTTISDDFVQSKTIEISYKNDLPEFMLFFNSNDAKKEIPLKKIVFSYL